jgi:hypothetical protein
LENQYYQQVCTNFFQNRNQNEEKVIFRSFQAKRKPHCTVTRIFEGGGGAERKNRTKRSDGKQYENF